MPLEAIILLTIAVIVVSSHPCTGTNPVTHFKHRLCCWEDVRGREEPGRFDRTREYGRVGIRTNTHTHTHVWLRCNSLYVVTMSCTETNQPCTCLFIFQCLFAAFPHSNGHIGEHVGYYVHTLCRDRWTRRLYVAHGWYIVKQPNYCFVLFSVQMIWEMMSSLHRMLLWDLFETTF